ncbi:hypothetical protein SDC9_105342 [bioreactor metagenome]|uniref:Uncharacterized protein n=1 Tax=bioreactor metagenome TaxID=1076179 RepID=A0A645B1R6_9ZZZZ
MRPDDDIAPGADSTGLAQGSESAEPVDGDLVFPLTVGTRADLAIDGTAHDVRLADEVDHEFGPWSLVDIGGGAELLDDATVHDSNPVGHVEGLVLIVSDKQRGGPGPLLNGSDLGAHRLAQFGVQVGQRLVEQQQGRFDDQGPGQRDALLLPTGQGFYVALGQMSELHHLQGLSDATGALLLGSLAHLEAEGHVLFDVHVREEGVGLEDHAHAALVHWGVRDGLAVHQDLSGGGVHQPCDDAQCGGLPASGWAQQSHQVSLLDLHVQVFDRGI